MWFEYGRKIIGSKQVTIKRLFCYFCMMQMNKKHFPKLNKKEWISVIEKSLKNGHISDFTWSPDRQIEGLPFAHREDVIGGIPPMVSRKENNDWLIGFISASGKLPVKLPGYHAVYFKSKHLQMAHFQSFLGKNTSLQEVTLLYSKNNLESLLALWNKVSTEEKGLTLQIAIPFDRLAQIDFLELMTVRTKWSIPFKLLVLMGKGGDNSLVDEWADFFEGLLTKLGEIEKEDLQKEFFHILRVGVWVSSAQILFETAQIRALKLLLYNIQKALVSEVYEVPIQAFISLESLSKDENHQLILATSAGMAAIMGGVQGLYYEAENMDDERSRLFRNIQLLLKEEAGLAQVEDPIAGSYAVEDLTASLARLVWEKMIKH